LVGGTPTEPVNDDPVKAFRAGEMFNKSSGGVHPVTRNPAAKA
jgi:hypothetical protein